MDTKTMKIIDSIPPFMTRYEEMVRKQKAESLPKRPCCQEMPRSLEAPIHRDIGLVGITYDMRPAPDYIPISESELLAKKEDMCTKKITPTERLQWRIDQPRRHVALHNSHEVLYFPMLYGRYKFEAEFAKYLWLVRSCRAKPDKTYIEELKKSFMVAAMRFKKLQRKVRINRLVLNDSIYCLGWFDHHSRLKIIKILAEAFRVQKEVLWISAENTQLLLDDGIRLLLAISIPTGYTLHTLHLWHFFRGGVLPILEEEYPEDPFVSLKLDISEFIIKLFYSTVVFGPSQVIPPKLQILSLHTAYYCLEYLKVLSVEYRYLAGGNGESMIYLGCIRFGNLRHLNILFTEYDSVEKTKRHICNAAWKRAFICCPCFRVHFIAYRVTSFSDLLPVMEPCMPLGSFVTSTGFKDLDVTVYLDVLMARLIEYYKRFLKRLNIHLVRPYLRIDYTLSKLLMELPFLEDFVYRGPVDNISSLHAILSYVENYNLRIKKLHFYLTEDPCQPEPYIKAMNDIYEQYEPAFVNKGIDFKLSTCQC